jgi:cyclopropane fatty-acyl-phospholipid synthase-like methyltransferase
MPGLGKVPERIRLALHQLDPQPGEQILEIGCGPGVAAALVADRIGSGGHLVAIDRSATALARARVRTADRADRITFVRTDLAGFTADRIFDKAFCVNVNVFWTGSAESELSVLRNCLRPGGTLFICYEAPRGRRPSERVVRRVISALARSGFLVSARSKPLLTFAGSL